MTHEAVLKDLRDKKYHPVYFLSGEEPYYIDVVSDFISANVLNEAEKSFNQTVYYGKDTSIENVITTARRFPMMASHQVVIVKEAQDLKKIDILDKYLDAPLKSTILVICYKKKLDGRTNFAKSLQKKCIYMDSEKIRDYKLPDWIVGHVMSIGYEIDMKSAVLLGDYLGADLGKIIGEINKLKIVLETKKTKKITPELIEQNIGISKEYNPLELNNALMKKDVLKANTIIRYFGKNPREYPMPLIIGFLFNTFSKLLIYYYVENKTDKKVLADSMGVPPFFLNDYIDAAKRYPARKLVEIISVIREYDLKSKGVNADTDDGELMKELVYKILH
ncbi:MAG: DNA polymerase III subunit delta [Bacteroidetes bacterium GWF2_38_335]|nr:MAG: DNA polymerase III subunit delta [Bacteroidetes bacterium GWF2_38_335]OFY77810.1 MAG: DNA polymerase III subunit delta [Bacteroidetes bacterium RIFOXYA12_FULL_38_20]HBS87384.1 DNA polymerase III subunit delta [Bacteroidales bacterium]